MYHMLLSLIDPRLFVALIDALIPRLDFAPALLRIELRLEDLDHNADRAGQEGLRKDTPRKIGTTFYPPLADVVRMLHSPLETMVERVRAIQPVERQLMTSLYPPEDTPPSPLLELLGNCPSAGAADTALAAAREAVAATVAALVDRASPIAQRVTACYRQLATDPKDDLRNCGPERSDDEPDMTDCISKIRKYQVCPSWSYLYDDCAFVTFEYGFNRAPIGVIARDG